MKKKVKVIVAAGAFMLLGIGLGFATKDAMAAYKSEFEIMSTNDKLKLNASVMEDKETGVQYIIVTNTGTNGSSSVAVCPRYNADGTYVVNTDTED